MRRRVRVRYRERVHRSGESGWNRGRAWSSFAGHGSSSNRDPDARQSGSAGSDLRHAGLGQAEREREGDVEMSYMHIENLYKAQDILAFKRCFALEKIHGTSAHVAWRDGSVVLSSGGEKAEIG